MAKQIIYIAVIDIYYDVHPCKIIAFNMRK
jgi:hypothetical protein